MALAALVAATTLVASAQDFPTLNGGSQRLGKNQGPLQSPGRALLHWFLPVFGNAGDVNQVIRDNGSSVATIFGPWVAPTFDQETGNGYRAFMTGNAAEDLVIGVDPNDNPFAINPPPRISSYLYAFTIPTAQGTDPRVKNFAADQLRTFEWVVEPFNVAERVARNYALYVWLPTGPTDDGAGNLVFPQRFFVYEITYANGKQWIDVVDTYLAGGGWVRLGNGGRPTGQLYDYDGTNPIRIKLFNTVQRRSGHENDVVGGPLTNWLSVYTDNPYSTVVYADAVKAVPSTGEIAATPIVSQIDPVNALLGTHTVFCRNDLTVGNVNGVTVTTVSPSVHSVDHTTGATRWTYTPLLDSQYTVTQDNNSAGVTVQPPFVATTTEPNFQGTNYALAPIVNVLGTESVVRYQPTLADGTYDVYAWCPGTRGAENLATATEVRIHEGATITTLTMNQDTATGWVKLGTRRFAHGGTTGNPLEVEITNYSAVAGDLGRSAYADAIRFVGAANLSILSTPLHVNALVRVNAGAPVATNVVIVATEDGKIHCVDANGNPDGTTNVYWTYPSTPDPNNASWTDPNAVATEDGGVATMPIGFDLSSALVENIGGADYLYIATRNGRVYCIEMAGRGDMNLATRLPGTTRRVWSFPDDFPSQAARSLLGSFTGSLAFATPPAGPTIYVPAPQGRLYALDALPAGPNAGKVTTVRWAFPQTTQPTLGPIQMTPMVVNNSVYFGTGQKADDDRGRYFSLDWNTGAVNWQFNGTTIWDIVGGGVNFIPADDFISGAAFGTAAELGGGMPDTIFVANENRWITALNSATGALLWTTDELQTGVLGNLSVTTIDAFDAIGIGTRTNAAVVMVPTADGRFDALYARAGVGAGATNRFGTKRAWEYVAEGPPILSSLSIGRAHMYGADSAGYIYAFNDTGDGTGQDIDGPGQSTYTENNTSPEVENFRSAKIKFVNKDTFQKLRLPESDAAMLTYAQAIAAANEVTRTQFDWGEYLYVLVYDIPYDTVTPAPDLIQVPAPVVNYAFSVDGAAFRNLSIETKQFKNPLTAPLAFDGVAHLDGYAVLAFPIQGGGSNALPPGKASVSVSISTSAAQNPPQQVNVALNPTLSRKDFGISNPIGIFMGTGALNLNKLIGVFDDPSEDGRKVNGNPDLASTPGNREDLLTAPVGVVSHSKAGNVTISVFDTSLMTLLRGPGQGVDNVRFDRQTLQWRGGQLAVVKALINIPFYATFYAGGKGIEDYPTEFPNRSLDYPDIDRENIRVVKEIFGNAENPVFNGVSLLAPDNVNESAPNYPTRTLVPTPFDLTVDVPRFQPPNFSTSPDSTGTNVDAGYVGRMSIFVDTDASGTVTRGGGRREAFRSFWMDLGVAQDNTFVVETPTIDFGTLASGTNYSPLAPSNAASNYTPFPLPTVPLGFDYDRGAYPYTELFKSIVVRNESNVNLINLRLAKYYDSGAGLNPWEIFSANDHEQVWLDGSLNLHASFDEQYALVPVPVLQKARVGDASGTLFSDIPYIRDNPNINAVAGYLFTPGVGGFPDLAREVLEKGPRVGISIPIGFPATHLASEIRIFEDLNFDESLSIDSNGNPLEPAAAPTATVKTGVREARMTNSFSKYTAPEVEGPASEAVGNENFGHLNVQPAVMRTRDGHLAAIFVSNRFGAPTGTGFDKTQPNAAENNEEPRLYGVSLQGANPNSIAGNSPLLDLNAFQPAVAAAWPNGRWWRHDVADYPTTPLGTLFPGDPVLAGTAKFGRPAFPGAGETNPFTLAAQPFVYLAFDGSVQKQGSGARYSESAIFLAPVNFGANGAMTIGAPIPMLNDPEMAKGKPSVIQVGSNATIFFAVAGTGQSTIQYVTFDGTNYGRTQPFVTGSGFESVGSPNVTGRVYDGVATQGTAATGSTILEVAFSGKLRGRSSNEIFMGRMACNASAAPNGQVFFPLIQRETLVADSETGVFRASGVVWNRGNTVQLSQSLNSALPVNIEVPNTRTVDETTGLITFNTTLGGKAYLDPDLGTVRLANSLPARGAELFLTYQPRFLRVSAGGATYANPTVMFDNRLIGETSYWATSAGGAITNADVVRPGRYMITYSKAADTNQVARPYMQTVRSGIQLPASIRTLPDGTVTGLTVTGASSYYQVDPANGRLYFTGADENRTVTVAFDGFDSAGNPVTHPATQYTIALLTERPEGPIPIDQAANETQMATFLDPFEGTNARRRPGVYWLFWTSTRLGPADVYFETIAPRFTPKAHN